MENIDFTDPNVRLLVLEYSKRLDEIRDYYEAAMQPLIEENRKLRDGDMVFSFGSSKTILWKSISMMKRFFNSLGALEMLQGMRIYRVMKIIAHKHIGD